MWQDFRVPDGLVGGTCQPQVTFSAGVSLLPTYLHVLSTYFYNLKNRTFWLRRFPSIYYRLLWVQWMLSSLSDPAIIDCWGSSLFVYYYLSKTAATGYSWYQKRYNTSTLSISMRPSQWERYVLVTLVRAYRTVDNGIDHPKMDDCSCWWTALTHVVSIQL